MLTSITTNKTSSLRIERMLSAPIERVYKAWTDPAQMKKWFGCEYVTDIEVVQDLSPGGQYQVKMTTHPGDCIITIHGVFREIRPNEKLVYTWNSDSLEYPAEDTLVIVEFIAHGASTQIILQHTNFALENSAQGHSVGWSASFNHIAELVTPVRS